MTTNTPEIPPCQNCNRPLSTKQFNMWEHRGLCNSCGPLFYKKVRRGPGVEYEVSVDVLMNESRARVAAQRAEHQARLRDQLRHEEQNRIRALMPFEVVWRIERIDYIPIQPLPIGDESP